METKFVDVIIPLPVPNLYTYRVPFELNDAVQPGARVLVPFGRRKIYTAIIRNIHENPPKEYTAKYIDTLLDEEPIVTGTQIKLWDWISEYYMSHLGEVMNVALPSHLKLSSDTKVVIHPDFSGEVDDLNDKETHLVDVLAHQDVIPLNEVGELLELKNPMPLINRLIAKRVVMTEEEVKERFRPKTAAKVFLSEDFIRDEFRESIITEYAASKRKEGQYHVLLRLVGQTHISVNDGVLKKELTEEGLSPSSISSLEKNGLIDIRQVEIGRLGDSMQDDVLGLPVLSLEQEAAYDQIHEQFKDKNTVLLHGITGSGKTEIYMRLMDEKLREGKQVLFLLPEIALTAQLVKRLQKVFGDMVGVYHSKFNQNERTEIWKAVLEDHPTRYRIIVGARSSLFLPFRSLGLVIVDEEHESSFKQHDPAPRYNGRDSAVVLGLLHKSKVLLGSATPSLESFHNAEEGRFGLVTLDKRYGNAVLPEILIADMQDDKRKKKNFGHFSSMLVASMQEELQKGKQIILFQNRRGYAPQWKCEMCSWTPGCKNCDIKLTYHKSSHQLRCHLCGYHHQPPVQCPACGSTKLSMVGFGTEKIEDDIELYFPGARVARMDHDTTRSKMAYEHIIQSFENKEVDILVGTQMISKGLDFDNVSLVGIMSSDGMLSFPDFRAFEKSFQLMSQVGGRAGRRGERGKVIIQSFKPEHWILQKVTAHDYMGMYKQELVERKNFHYPPFYRIVKISVRHKKEYIAESASADLANKLRMVFKERVLGPEYPLIPRVRNYYNKEITLKFEKKFNASKVKEAIINAINSTVNITSYKTVRVSIDVDPI